MGSDFVYLLFAYGATLWSFEVLHYSAICKSLVTEKYAVEELLWVIAQSVLQHEHQQSQCNQAFLASRIISVLHFVVNSPFMESLHCRLWQWYACILKGPDLPSYCKVVFLNLWYFEPLLLAPVSNLLQPHVIVNVELDWICLTKM